MFLRCAGIIEESIVDGPGIRLVVFTQGCNLHCRGCQNPETWDLNGGTLIPTDDILHMIDNNPLLDGITLSGGEPFLQPDACYEVAKGAKERGLDVMIYSGFTYEELRNSDDSKRGLLSIADMLVDGSFMIEKKSLDLLFRGSSNQRLLYLKDSEIVKVSEE